MKKIILISALTLFGCSSPVEKVTNGKSCTDCDLRGADLSSLTLRNIDLSNSDLSNANLSNTVFANVNFANANLNNANLTNIKATYFDDGGRPLELDLKFQQNNKIQTSFFKADLSGANLSEASFEYTFFDEADLTNANLTGASFESSSLNNAILINATLTGATIGGNLTGTNFTNANLIGASIELTFPADFDKVNLTNAILIGTDFGRADLSKVIIQKIDKKSIFNKLARTVRELKKRDGNNSILRKKFEDIFSFPSICADYSPQYRDRALLTGECEVVVEGGPVWALIGRGAGGGRRTEVVLEQASRSGSLKAYTLLKNLSKEIYEYPNRSRLSSAQNIIYRWQVNEEIYVHEYDLKESAKNLYGLYKYEYDLDPEEKKLLRILANFYIDKLHYVRDYHDDELHNKSLKELSEYIEFNYQQSIAFSGVNSCVSPVFDYAKIRLTSKSSSVALIAGEQYLDQSQSILEQYDIYEDCLKNAYEKFVSRSEILFDRVIKITYELNIPRKMVAEAEENREKLLEEATEEYQKNLYSLVRQLYDADEMIDASPMTKEMAYGVAMEKRGISFALAGGFTAEELSGFFANKKIRFQNNMNGCLSAGWYDEYSSSKRTFILNSFREFIDLQNNWERVAAENPDAEFEEVFETLREDFARKIQASLNRCVMSAIEQYMVN